MPFSLKKFTNRNTIILPLRLYLGSLFVYACIHKISQPADFADTVASFEMLPYWAVNAVAIALPWIEFWAGAFLILGLFVRSSVMLLTVLLVTFWAATLVNVLRGAQISCGCFPGDINHPITLWTLTRDIVWLFMALTILFLLERRVIGFPSIKRKKARNHPMKTS
jgi:putative oxidoreductase